MKNIHKILIALGVVITLFFLTATFTHAALTPVSWIRDTVAGFLRPGVLTDTLRIPSLTNCDTIDTDADGDFACGTDGGGGGGSIILDLADNGSNESSGIAEIATSGDTNSIFSEPSADKLLINLALDWPKADTSDDLTCTDCIGTTEISDDYVLNIGDTITGDIEMDGDVYLNLDDTGLVRFSENDANGSNFKGFTAPASLTASTTCTFEDDASFIPDSCVGDGVDGGGTIDGSGTTNEITYWVDSDTLGALAVATYPSLTELSYVKGVTSAIQTQLGGKLNDTGDIGTGVFDFGGADSFEIVNDAAPTVDKAGEIALDTTVTGFDKGVVKFYSNGVVQGVVSMPETEFTSPTDGHVVAYNASTEVFELVAGGGGSGDITSVGDVTSGAAFDGTQGTILTFNDAGGDATLEYDNTNNWFEFSSILNPSANDGATLGNATQSWSDLFLASGAVTNWNNGDMTLTHSSNALRFGGGLVGFSDAAPVTVTGTERVMFEDADGNNSDWSFRVAGGGSGTINFAESNGTLASPTVAAEFDTLGEIGFYGHDGTNYERAAYIRSFVDATPGNNDMPGTIVFATTPDGSTTASTRLKIAQDGQVLANGGADNVMYDCIELGLDPYSNIVAGTNKDSVVMPYAMTVTHVYASLTTGPTGSVATFDINEAGTSIISTKITIDASETSSQTAATPAVISDSAVAKGAILSFDIDGVGSTTPGNGIHTQVCGPINY